MNALVAILKSLFLNSKRHLLISLLDSFKSVVMELISLSRDKTGEVKRRREKGTKKLQRDFMLFILKENEFVVF